MPSRRFMSKHALIPLSETRNTTRIALSRHGSPRAIQSGELTVLTVYDPLTEVLNLR